MRLLMMAPTHLYVYVYVVCRTVVSTVRFTWVVRGLCRVSRGGGGEGKGWLSRSDV